MWSMELSAQYRLKKDLHLELSETTLNYSFCTYGWVGGWGPQYHVRNRGSERVRGDVKLVYSAGELLKAPVPNEP